MAPHCPASIHRTPKTRLGMRRPKKNSCNIPASGRRLRYGDRVSSTSVVCPRPRTDRLDTQRSRPWLSIHWHLRETDQHVRWPAYCDSAYCRNVLESGLLYGRWKNSSTVVLSSFGF